MVKTGQEINRIISQYIEKLKELGINVTKAIIYGSYATGQAKEDSDIDLIIISEDFKKMSIRERLEILGIAAGRIMQPIQAKGYTSEEIRSDEKGLFLEAVLSYGKVAA